MSAPINLESYSDALVVLGTAGVVVPLVRRLGLSPVLGYLAAGAILGPLGLGSFIHTVPLLYWFTIVDAKNVAGIADLGVVFLLFVIGMELSYERLKAMRYLVFGLGGLQVLLTTIAIGAALMVAGIDAEPAAILGACLALSSTAIVVEVLAGKGRLSTTSGRASFAVLLAQDLAVVPILVFISIAGADTSDSIGVSILLALAHAAVAIGGIVVIGRLLLRPLFRLVAATGSRELFIAATLFVIVGTGLAAAVAGMSMALGAFVAGLLIAETEFRKAIEVAIGPSKGLLLGLFFFTIGMNIDFRELAREPLGLAAAVAGLIALKAMLMIALARAFRLPWAAAIETGLVLGPGGEFAFVGIGMAAALGVVDARMSSFTLAVTSLTMALIPALGALARRIAGRLQPPKPLDPELTVAPRVAKGHAIVVGYGRVGRVLCAMLARHNFSYVAVDKQADAVAGRRGDGHEVYYGDATDPVFLKACGVMEAVAVVVTIAARKEIDEIVAEVLRLRPDIVIVSRARDAAHASHLYSIGVTDAVPETIEASLQLSEATLVGLGVPTGPVIASIHDKRDEFRRQLRQASGRDTTRSLRATTRKPSLTKNDG
ncbi:cation:proton antiporter [Xanthobacteraceae bacterium Astr-EGSB]|uniref:cation:proton antiporter domain-containing protein n=1 Tax=Astrobacterium formosum TaxID=3069710 RepID=UPI0027B0F003|nr:cation:proton antiporter [Xanthobacteraceae bacterium Astr-EGSB]